MSLDGRYHHPKPVSVHRPRVAFYSHDTMGLGHLRRNLLIASALSADPVHADTLVIAGTREACHFAMQAGIDCVTLPALSKDSRGNYSGKHLGWDCVQTTTLRSRIIAGAIEAFSPDIFVIDKVPRGIGNELDETFARIGSYGRTRCILGLREILDDPQTVIRQWEYSGCDRAIEDHFDEVWVYGDRSIYDCAEQYQFSDVVRKRLFYTGYLDQSRRITIPQRSESGVSRERKRVVCTVGGGQDGMRLAACFATAELPARWEGVLITGPYLPDADRAWLRQTLAGRDEIHLIEDVVEADRYIAQSDRVISMAGYNTIASILSFRKPALVVPRVTPRKEQWIRAKILADQGFLSLVEPFELSPDVISRWMEHDTANWPQQSVDLGGLDRIVQRVKSLLPQPASHSVPSQEAPIVSSV